MRWTFVLAVIALSATNVASGQGTDQLSESGVPQRGAARGQPANRAGLELQLRQKLNRRVRVELGLDADQMTKLAEVNRRFAPQHRALDQRENQTRKALRQALLEAPSSDQEQRVGDLHEQIMQMQQQRLDLAAAQQKALSGFLTNVQRVRFQALQENFRHQLQDGLRQQAGAQGSRAGPPPR